MLNRIVPTVAGEATWASVVASIANTSVSGRLKRMPLFQLRPSSSSQRLVVLSNLTIRPTSGAVVPCWLTLGPGLPPGTIGTSQAPPEIAVQSAVVVHTWLG